MIKLICCDLDGTLLTDDKRITEINKNAINAFREKGGHFVLATGRPLNGVLPLIKELNLLDDTDSTICYNGGVITLNKSNKVLYSTSITGSLVKELYKESVRLNVFFHFFSEDGTLYTSKKNEYTAVEERINHLEALVIDPLTLDDNAKFIKAMMVCDSNSLDKARINLNPKFFDLAITRSSKIFLEFQNKGVSKGKGLLFLKDYYNLKDDETCAFGDEENDISMIEEAFKGIAMENARDIVKNKASFITLSNNNSGVGEYIYKHILNSNYNEE